MADTNTRPGQVDGIGVTLLATLSNDTSQRAAVSQLLTTIAVSQVYVLETNIATETTIVLTPAVAFLSAGNFKFVAVIVADSSASTSMQIEVNNSGNLVDVTNGIAYGGDASTSQIEIRNNSAASTMDVYVVLGR